MISAQVDWWMGCLKWPAAALAVALAPGAAWAGVMLVGRVLSDPAPMVFFLLGAAGYAAVWYVFLRHSRNSYWLTLEHELTHALFAWLTFHKVTRIHATATQGGYMQYVGKGNWLITIAPYFFPTASLLVMLVLWLLPGDTAWLGGVLLGATLTYHITSTLRETHPGQSDLKRVGWLFALLFLPGANLVTVGGLLALAQGAGAGVWQFLGEAGEHTWAFWAGAAERLG